MAPRRPYRSPATVRRARGVAKRQLNEDPDQVPALSELEQRLRYRAALARSHGPTDYLGRCVASDRKTRSGRSDEVGVVSLFCGADLGCLPFNKAPFVYLSGFEIDGRFEEMHARNYGEGRLHVADALEMSHLQVLAVVRKAERARGVKVRALHVVVTMCCKDASRAAGRPVDTAYYHRCVEWVKRVVKALRAKYAPVTHSWEFTDTPAVREAIFRAFPGLCCTVLLGTANEDKQRLFALGEYGSVGALIRWLDKLEDRAVRHGETAAAVFARLEPGAAAHRTNCGSSRKRIRGMDDTVCGFTSNGLSLYGANGQLLGLCKPSTLMALRCIGSPFKYATCAADDVRGGQMIMRLAAAQGASPMVMTAMALAYLEHFRRDSRAYRT
ncbi:hypothetical protein M885DRAFT_538060 [Pelagophyceae sp. CCMP2097]|nr:hypothetical protein M885DRAFT_538060 [Pelagophyceae sp. CCMP2097]